MNQKPTRTHRWNPWPAGIIGSFGVFICGAAVFITWAVGQNMDLVRKDYYEHEILYQQRIDELQRTKPLHSEISVSYNSRSQEVDVRLPLTHGLAGVAGQIHVYRPSDAKLDRHIALAVGGSQAIDTKDWPCGLWKFQISWEAAGPKYYYEQPLFISDGQN